jgi:hypothetical protein
MTTTATTVSVYGPALRAQGYVSNPTAEVATTRTTPGMNAPPKAHSPSIWANLIETVAEYASIPLVSCRHEANDLRHFNRLSVLLNHCDFHSIQLPGLNDALENLRQVQSTWEEAIARQVGVFGDLADVTYADVDYPPRPRRYDAAVVRVDPPSVTRVKRIYTDDDAEVWGP